MADDLTVALFTGRELRGEGPAPFVREAQPDIVAGHGLGDIAALVAADVLDLSDALRLAVLREQLIAHASEHGGGGMLAISGDDAASAAARITELSGAYLARHDSPRRAVVAGSHDQLLRAHHAAADMPVHVADLRAPAALHCRLMETSAAVFASVLEGIAFRHPVIPVYSSLTAAPVGDPRAELGRCLAEPVLWSETVRALEAAGAARFVETGSTLGDLVCETLGAELARAA